jgi:hypothetical protein
MKKFACLFILIALALPFGFAHAQQPPDPENACFEGGSMAGKCQSAWEWVCGYYLAHWEAAGGWFNPANNLLPDWCASLLPPRSIISNFLEANSNSSLPPFPSAGCLFEGGVYINFGGSYFVFGGPFYTNATCTPPDNAAGYNGPIVYAPAPYSPTALCQAAGGSGVNSAAANDIYYCTR